MPTPYLTIDLGKIKHDTPGHRRASPEARDRGSSITSCLWRPAITMAILRSGVAVRRDSRFENMPPHAGCRHRHLVRALRLPHCPAPNEDVTEFDVHLNFELTYWSASSAAEGSWSTTSSSSSTWQLRRHPARDCRPWSDGDKACHDSRRGFRSNLASFAGVVRTRATVRLATLADEVECLALRSNGFQGVEFGGLGLIAAAHASGASIRAHRRPSCFAADHAPQALNGTLSGCLPPVRRGAQAEKKPSAPTGGAAEDAFGRSPVRGQGRALPALVDIGLEDVERGSSRASIRCRSSAPLTLPGGGGRDRR